MTHAAFPLASALVAVFAMLGSARGAVPERPPAGASSPEPKCRDTDPGERLHDGFFARSDTSLSFLWANVSGSASRSRVRGVGQGAALSIGGTPARGWVLGGTLWTARVDPVFIENGQTITPDDDSVKVTLLRVGPFVDLYPDPARGFHAQAALQFAVQIESDVKGDPLEPAALGAALSTGAGYEWFISSEVSLGLLARATLGRVGRAPRGGDEQTLFIVPELGLSATYH